MNNAVRTAIAAVLVLGAALAVLAPIGPLPGIMIGGSETPVPESWPDTSGVHEIRLEVEGTIPRVVIIWVIDHGGELHVSGYKSSGWVTMLGDGGAVRMRLGDNTYSLVAEPVTDRDEQLAVLTDYMNKYRPDYPDIVAGFPSIEEAGDSYAVYRLARP